MSGNEQYQRRRPSGRRAGDSGTRDAIQDAALTLFAEDGYDATSIRAIAAAAGVDPALVRHFYTDKPTLFAAMFAARLDIPATLAATLAGDPETRGRRLTDTYLRMWDDPATRPTLLALVKAAMTSGSAATMLAEAMGVAMAMNTQGTGIAPPRLVLAASHLLGVAIARHILKFPPIVTMTHDELVAAVSPAIQGYLDPGAPAAG